MQPRVVGTLRGLAVVALLLYRFSAEADHYGFPGEVPMPIPPGATLHGRHHSPDIACAEDQCLAVWMWFEDKDPFSYEIRGARIHPTGQVLDNVSLTIASVSMMNTSRPQVAWLRSSYVVLYGGLMTARVSAEGRVLSRDVPLPFSDRLSSGRELVATGDRALLFWERNEGPLIPHLTVLDADLALVKEVRLDSSYPIDVAKSGSGFVALGLDGTSGHLSLTRISLEGVAEKTAITIPFHARTASVASNGESVLVAWWDDRSSDVSFSVQSALVRNGIVEIRTLETYYAPDRSFFLDVAAVGAAYLVCWSRTSPAYYNHNIFARRIGASGQLLDPAPFSVSAGAHPEFHLKVAAAGQTCVAVWTDGRLGIGHDHIFGALVPASGPAGDDFLVSRSAPAQSAPAVAAAGEVLAVAWQEPSGGGIGPVRVARIRDRKVVDDPAVLLSSRGGKPALATDGRDFLLAWREPDAVQIALLSRDGTVAARQTVASSGSSAVGVAAHSENYLVAWQEHDRILALRLGHDGTPRDTAPMEIAAGGECRVASDGQAYWITYLSPDGSVQAQRLSAGGRLMDPIPLTLSESGLRIDDLAIACSESGCLILWTTLGTDLNSVLVTPFGSVIQGVVVAPMDAIANQPAVTFDGRKFLVAWSSRDHAQPDFDVRAATLSPAGFSLGDLSLTALPVAASPLNETSPAIASGQNGAVFAFSRSAQHATDAVSQHVIVRFVEEPQRRRGARR